MRSSRLIDCTLMVTVCGCSGRRGFSGTKLIELGNTPCRWCRLRDAPREHEALRTARNPCSVKAQDFATKACKTSVQSPLQDDSSPQMLGRIDNMQLLSRGAQRQKTATREIWSLTLATYVVHSHAIGRGYSGRTSGSCVRPPVGFWIAPLRLSRCWCAECSTSNAKQDHTHGAGYNSRSPSSEFSDVFNCCADCTKRLIFEMHRIQQNL